MAESQLLLGQFLPLPFERLCRRRRALLLFFFRFGRDSGIVARASCLLLSGPYLLVPSRFCRACIFPVGFPWLLGGGLVAGVGEVGISDERCCFSFIFL